MADTETDRRSRLDAALASARETRAVEIGRGALARVVEMFRAQFGDREPVIVSDSATFNAAGRTVQDVFAPFDPLTRVASDHLPLVADFRIGF